MAKPMTHKPNRLNKMSNLQFRGPRRRKPRTLPWLVLILCAILIGLYFLDLKFMK